jgi:RimJ/RimL family protein N-acetyltransferase
VIEAFRRRALASEAARLLAGWGFAQLPLDALHIDVEAANDGSRRIAENLGAVAVGTFHRQLGSECVALSRYTLKVVP